ncbi:hypothetical protein CP533_3043 [Ophiocordyceps camponoti-saundersi (nom. inval.)]|nr:hypothetical protein CP533_3043 [Ophiocordyceps camponoti-saundersi (nom. inval.)]
MVAWYLVLAFALPALGRVTPRASATPQLPETGGCEELPSPQESDKVSLKYITLGFGVQNYTCKENEPKAKATGALAVLYDVTTLHPGQGPNALSSDEFNALTKKVLAGAANPIKPKSMDGCDSDTKKSSAATSAAGAGPFEFPPAAELAVKGADLRLKPVGEHFFDSNKVPIFRLNGDKGEIDVAVKKLDDVPSPDKDAVAWLRLGSKDAAAAGGAKFVYRVLTAGGVSRDCSSAPGDSSVPYTATYWFFG